MINSDQIVYLKIDKKTKLFISVLVALVFSLFSLLSVYYVVIKPDPSEDFRLAVISLLPSAAMILFGWILLLKIKSSLSEQDLMQQTSRLLRVDLPRAISRRAFGFQREKEGDFRQLSVQSSKEPEETIDLYDEKWIEEAQKVLSIRSNVMVGIPSCVYRFSGEFVPQGSCAEKLEMHIQVNVKRVEVIYKLPAVAAVDVHIFDSVVPGTEGAGYKVERVVNERHVEMQARIDVGSEMLVNSRERLFIINDIAVMTAYLLKELAGKDCGGKG